MAIDISAPNCTNNWLSGVASTGTFTKASGMTDWPNGFPYGIPQGWTVESLDVFINEGNWNEDSNWSANSVPTDGSNVVIAANVTIPSDYVANAGEININSGKTLTIVDGGQLIHTNAVNATLQKTISAYSDQQGVTDGWYTIASPVTGNYSTESLTVGNYDLYLYHEPTHTWWNSKGDLQNGHGFNTLANGKGYLYANAAEKTLAFVGETPATNATVNMPLSYTEAADNLKGFNLVGNPFTRNLTAADGIKIGETDLTTYYYVAGESELQTTTLAERDIKPGEGFFVQAETANQDIAINTSNSGRKKGADYAFVCIEAGNDIFMDRAYIQIGDGNSLRKMSLNDRTPKISVMNDGKDYAAASIDAVQGEIPVHFEPAENGTYILRVKTMYLESDYLHLVDNLTGNDIDLLQTPTYTFEARTSDYASRFKLVFNAQHGDVDGNEGFAFFSNGELVVNGTGTIQIIDVAGRQLFNREINSAFRIPHSEFSPGVYLLRLVNGECVRTQKIVLNK